MVGGGDREKTANVHDPVTTTKALLLLITAPRKFSAPKKTPSSVSTGSTRSADTPVGDKSGKSNGNPKTKLNKKKSSSGDSLLGETPPPIPSPETMEVKVFSDGVTMEETAAVTVEATAPENGKDIVQEMAIIDVEELLRISFHKLAEEWHLLNVPTYSIVNRLSKVEIIKDESLNFRIEVTEEEEEAVDWIQVTVMVRPPSLENVLERLERIGVGANCGTVTVVNSELCRTASPLAHDPPVNVLDEEVKGQKVASHHRKTSSMEITEIAARERALEAARAEWKNAATRVRIEQVREQILEQSAFSFDFISLLIVASVLAGIGLITNNTVVIVASMLVSPIMGPVLGVTFGTRVRDWPLVWTSLWHETLALAICVIIGVMVGLLSSFSELPKDWPTNEMQIRGEYAGLVTGIAIALPSGMGVCLSILGGNTSSLVGVAISASLLPPAVNAGICLVYSLMLHAGAFTESNEDAEEFAIIGGISFALTVVNIICIWLAGLAMFQIKEVTPTEAKNAFWARDIKVAREMNRRNSISRPIDTQLIREGIQVAGKGEINKKFKLRFRPKTEKPLSSNNLDTAFAIGPYVPRKSWRTDNVFADEAEDPEADGEDAHFLGLEDMGRLLGFDQEDVYEDESGAEIQRHRRRFFNFPRTVKQ